MSRSGYIDDCDDYLQYGRWRAQVKSATNGKRGQAFLKELAEAMDAMSEKRLIANELISDSGECCTIGVVCKSRKLDVSKVDIDEPKEVGALVGIAHQLAAEIEFENDEGVVYNETPEELWHRMRTWVGKQISQS